MSELADIRQVNFESDLNFILNSWLKSNLENSPRLQLIPKEIYFTEKKKEIVSTLTTAKVLVAVDKESANHIYGYMVYTPPSVLHFTYIKYPFRKFGIAKQLMEEANLTDIPIITHLPKHHDRKLIREKYIYNPFHAKENK